MNGVLAWVQDTGMPMRPAMSTMMTTDSPPRHAADEGVTVTVDIPAGTVAARPTTARIRITDTACGRPVDDIGRSHEARMHFIVTRDDPATFAHIHPRPTDEPGVFTTEVTFPTAGRYVIHTGFRRQGAMSDLVERHEVVVDGPTRDAQRDPAPSPRTQVVDGIRITFDGDATAGENRFAYRFTDVATGAPVTDLRPYLAAAGHVVVMPVDGTGFAHEHAEARDRAGNPVFALPSQRFGPELEVRTDLPRAGLYRIWGQFRTAAGAVVTTSFTVQADAESIDG